MVNLAFYRFISLSLFVRVASVNNIFEYFFSSLLALVFTYLYVIGNFQESGYGLGFFTCTLVSPLCVYIIA